MSKLAKLSDDHISLLLQTSPNFTREQVLVWYSEFSSFADANDNLNLNEFIRFYKSIMSKKNGDVDDFCKFIFKGMFNNFQSFRSIQTLLTIY
jgi:hypothetical protein